MPTLSGQLHGILVTMDTTLNVREEWLEKRPPGSRLVCILLARS